MQWSYTFQIYLKQTNISGAFQQVFNLYGLTVKDLFWYVDIAVEQCKKRKKENYIFIASPWINYAKGINVNVNK